MNNKNYLNLSLRSIFHLFVSGSLFYFCKSHFNLSLSLGVIGAFITAVTNEIFEDVRKIENSFHTNHVFKRDRTLAALSVFFTGTIIRLHWLLATLAAPVSLLVLTSYIDKKTTKEAVGPRNLIKPLVDITALTLGPLACVAVVALINR